MDPGTGSWPRHPLGRELFLLAGTKTHPAATGREDRDRASENSAAGAGMDPDVAERKTCQGKGPHQLIRSAAEPGDRKACARPGDLRSAWAAIGPGRD